MRMPCGQQRLDLPSQCAQWLRATGARTSDGAADLRENVVSERVPGMKDRRVAITGLSGLPALEGQGADVLRCDAEVDIAFTEQLVVRGVPLRGKNRIPPTR